jgi:hypothetical protein
MSKVMLIARVDCSSNVSSIVVLEDSWWLGVQLVELELARTDANTLSDE